MSTDNKTCLITGAAMGLGFEFSKLAASEHYHLLLLDKNGEKLEKVRQFLQETYPVSVDVFRVDLSSPDVTVWLDSFVDNHEIDMLINNAGFGLYGKFNETDWTIEAQMINLHVLNLTFLTKKVIKKMLLKNKGKIMNVSSMAAFQPGPYSSLYFATKAYIKSFSIAIAHELRDTGVTVTVLCPGQVNTGFAAEVALRSRSVTSKVPFTSSAVKVAKTGYRGMLKGKSVVIPGLNNQIIAFLTHLLPSTLTAYMNGKIQQRIRKGKTK